MSFELDSALTGWLDGAAGSLDRDATRAGELVPQLGAAHLFRIGVPARSGGLGGEVADAMEAIAAVSARSLAAGFVFWSQRTFADYLLQSPNESLAAQLLPDILAGRVGGATGLSNAMKFLSGLEELQVQAQEEGGNIRLDGRMPWVTNLRPQAFHVAAVAQVKDGAEPMVVSLRHDLPGLTRSPDLELIAMRGTNTAAVKLEDVRVDEGAVLSREASNWCFRVRPTFLALQCGLAIGIARRGFAEARAHLGPTRTPLGTDLTESEQALEAAVESLKEGLRSGSFASHPAPLFRLRIRLAELAARAVMLELQASGGKAYLAGPGEGFARRWRESAFLPVITPSIVQLRGSLLAQAAEVA